MNYETAKRRKNACITGFLIITMWGWSGLSSHSGKIQNNPETGLLVFGCAFGIPILILFILAIFYSIKAKQAEYDELDDDFNSKKQEQINQEDNKE